MGHEQKSAKTFDSYLGIPSKNKFKTHKNFKLLHTLGVLSLMKKRIQKAVCAK